MTSQNTITLKYFHPTQQQARDILRALEDTQIGPTLTVWQSK